MCTTSAHELALANLARVPALRRLYDAASEHDMLDRNWHLVAPEENVLLRGERESDWESDWIDFASDGCGNTLLLATESGEVVMHGTDPPGHRRLGLDLHAWFVACVEGEERRAAALGPRHARDIALLMAVDAGSLDGVRVALDAGASADAKDELSSAIASAAAQRECRAIVELLLERGTNASLPAWDPPIFRALRSARGARRASAPPRRLCEST